MFRFRTALVAVFLALSFIAPALGATTGLVRGTITVDGKRASGAAVVLDSLSEVAQRPSK